MATHRGCRCGAMIRSRILAPLVPLALLAGALSGCAASPASEARIGSVSTVLPMGTCSDRGLAPLETIDKAAAVAPHAGVAGCFRLTVKAWGEDHGRVFLNSEADYRDPRNVSVRLEPPAVAALDRMLGRNGAARLVGRSLLVRGTAYRVRIDFTSSGRPTGKYYYQTHIVVTELSQIRRPEIA